MIEAYSRCRSCEAITVFDDDGKSYSCGRESKKKYLNGIDLRRLKKLADSYCCNYCVNRWGLDLCACGSGERYDKCSNGFPECGRPAQEIGGYDHVVGNDWLARLVG